MTHSTLRPIPQQMVPDSRVVLEAMATPYLLVAADPPHFTIVDANGVFVAAASSVLGAAIRREDLLGRGYFEVFFPEPDWVNDDRHATGRNMRASFERVLATRVPDALPPQRYDGRAADGTFEERHWLPTNAPIFDADGRVTHIIHLAKDITYTVELTRARAAAQSAGETREASRAPGPKPSGWLPSMTPTGGGGSRRWSRHRSPSRSSVPSAQFSTETPPSIGSGAGPPT